MDVKAVFVELPPFEHFRADYLDDDAFLKLQRLLMLNPEAGALIPGTGGLRKLRFADERRGKRTLRTHSMEFKPAPTVTPKELVRVRKNLKLSRALFAIYLRTNVRTLENWEQGRAKPNAQAALLINLVKHYPDTVQRLASI